MANYLNPDRYSYLLNTKTVWEPTDKMFGVFCLLVAQLLILLHFSFSRKCVWMFGWLCCVFLYLCVPPPLLIFLRLSLFLCVSCVVVFLAYVSFCVFCCCVLFFHSLSSFVCVCIFVYLSLFVCVYLCVAPPLLISSSSSLPVQLSSPRSHLPRLYNH